MENFFLAENEKSVKIDRNDDRGKFRFLSHLSTFIQFVYPMYPNLSIFPF